MTGVDGRAATKTCPMCFEDIDQRARRCPHCRAWQTAGAAWRDRHPLLTAVVGGLVGAAVFGLLMAIPMLMFSRLRPGKLARYRGQIKVVSSELVFGDSKDGPVACAIGRVRNDSDIAWQRIHLQATFLDPGGKPIDVAGDRMFRYISNMLPRGEAAFKVTTLRHLPQEKYASCSVSITYAQEAWIFP